MRIGELAAIAGVSTRTVRHYHRVGLLPEPARQANGYREYGLRDAVELARVRRLTELGLSLDEVRDALADDAGKDLREILAELDADLGRQQEALGRRRARLAELLERAESGGGLGPEDPVSPELAEIFDAMARTAAGRGGPESAMAAKERELLAFLEATADRGNRDWLLAMTRALSGDPDAMARAYEIYARLDELADAAPGDPRIEEVARAVADSMRDGVGGSGAEGESVGDDGTGSGGVGSAGSRSDGGGGSNNSSQAEETGGFAEAFFADFPPAQAEVLRRAMVLVQQRGRP